MTWPIEEMPYDGVASYYLASLQMNYILGSDLSELPCDMEMMIYTIYLDLG